MMKACLLAVGFVLCLSSFAFAAAESDYRAIFGEEEKTVLDQGAKAAPPFAAKLLAATKSVGEQKDLLILLCEKAYAFGLKDPAGYETAAEAMKLLAEAAPDKKDFAQEKLLELLRLRSAKSKGDERTKCGQELLDMLMTRGDEQTAAGKYSEATVSYREAVSVAEACKSERTQELKEKIQAVASRQDSEKKLVALKARLEKNLKDVAVRTELILAYLGELDNPAEAVKLLNDDLDEKVRTYVPLAAKKIEDLEEAPCLELAQWYMEVSDKLATVGKQALLGKAQTCCERYLELHATQDAGRLKAQVLLDKVAKAEEKTGVQLPRQITLALGKGVTMKLVLIPAGRFKMGSPEGQKEAQSNEGPQHEVTISKAFYMGVYEVTQGQYEAVIGKGPGSSKVASSPVDGVSWDNAVEFCKRLSKKSGMRVRLPTEADWEYACRAGSTARFCFGDDDAELDHHVWYTGNSNGKKHPVGQKKPNAWGLYDMHGNVSEWCADWGGGSYANRKNIDPQGPDSGVYRVLRGGSWSGTPQVCRSAQRDWDYPDPRYHSIGFRVVLDRK